MNADRLMQGVAGVVREFVAKETAPLREKLATLESKEPPAPEIDVEAFAQRVATQLMAAE